MTGYPSIDKPWLKYYTEKTINATLPECTIYDYLWENNKDYQSNIALNYFDRKITYGEVFANIDKATKMFKDRDEYGEHIKKTEKNENANNNNKEKSKKDNINNKK